LRLLDLKNGSPSANYLTAPSRMVAGGDQLSGGDGVDVMFGQDGMDTISGGAGDDYAEGNGDHDVLYGDRTLVEAGIAIVHPSPDWPGSSNNEADISSPNGQDDLIGGSSIQGFRDSTDDVHGDGAADFILGDNGTAVRDIVDHANHLVTTVAGAATAPQPFTNRIYAKRYASPAPSDAAYVRHGTTATTPTRFCTTAQATCEPSGAFGNDNLWGDGGQDTIYGQDGDDHIYGDTGSTAKVDATSPAVVNDNGGIDPAQNNDDDLYGELGNDIMYGELGDDAMVGDRGGIVDQYQSGTNDFTIDDTQVPQIHYEGFIAGSVTRQTDLQHDVNGDAFIAGSVMPHRGDTEGGTDMMRGGLGHDSMHGGNGDDIMNGDSGGDIVFGDDGADVLWGGQGCDATIDVNTPDCQTNGTFDQAARGTKDRFVDYINGGKGADGNEATDPSGGLGADLMDWHPRGAYSTTVFNSSTCTQNAAPQSFGSGKTVTTVDPCSWFFMTDLDDANVANNQHHQGIDWQYGGWDRDILQGDVADNGPNMGDRLLDWTGAYNLYTHCNAAYGGYNDVRQFSPDMQTFLQKWAWSLGAGVTSSDVTTSGSSAFDELALTYQSDNKAHGTGAAFPSTPGHFDNPNSCAP
jgi:Ca2+-binding RTX toxin-like protein